jgi:hypothetical protein
MFRGEIIKEHRSLRTDVISCQCTRCIHDDKISPLHLHYKNKKVKIKDVDFLHCNPLPSNLNLFCINSLILRDHTADIIVPTSIILINCTERRITSGKKC